MVNIAENIEIKSIGSQLLLNCSGDFASQETILGETNNGLKFNQVSPAELPNSVLLTKPVHNQQLPYVLYLLC